jgi:hypothetical protein
VGDAQADIMAVDKNSVRRVAGYFVSFLINHVPAAVERVLTTGSQAGSVEYMPNVAGSARVSVAPVSM